MAKFQFARLIGTIGLTTRLGSSDEAAGRLNDKDAGKFVKLAGDSRYDLAAAGSDIEAAIIAVDTATSDGYSTGSVQTGDRLDVVLDGLQATPGTGSIAIGDYVVVGTPVAKGVALTDAGPKVCKATDQAVAKASPFAWRLVAIFKGTGAVGTTGLIEKVGR